MAPTTTETLTSPPETISEDKLFRDQRALELKELIYSTKRYIQRYPTIEDKDGDLILDPEEGAGALYPQFLPSHQWSIKHEIPEVFEAHDVAKDADPKLPNLLTDEVTVTNLTPKFGSEVSGFQLSKLTDAQKNELALLAEKRGMLVIRDQDLKDQPLDDIVRFGEYFGPLHVHPATGSPKGYPQIHVVYRAKKFGSADPLQSPLSSVGWHSDISYEPQPAGLSFLAILEQPESGGDTLFGDMVQAYNRLSPAMQKFLEGLTVAHSGLEQGKATLDEFGGKGMKRGTSISEHPVVRTHPVTGEKALFVNSSFSRRILQLKREESDALLSFLYDHIAKGQEFQARAVWRPGTVVVWDNRKTVHSALFDWDTEIRRHGFRLTPLGEKPF